MSLEYAVSLRRRIAAAVAAHERHEIPGEDRAAVAVTVVDRGGRAGYLFIRRALTLSHNARSAASSPVCVEEIRSAAFTIATSA